MAYAALTVLLQSLDQYSHPNPYLFLVNNPQFQLLTETLEFLKEFLESSTNNCNDREITNALEAKIRDLSYKAQDVIEEFISENPCSGEPINIFDSHCSIHLTLHQFFWEFDSIKTEAIKVRQGISADESMVQEEISETISGDESAVKEIAANIENDDYFSPNPEDTVVKNVDEGLKIIVDRLISSSPRLEIFSFFCQYRWRRDQACLAMRELDNFGILVHNHPLVANHFDLRVLIRRSRTYPDYRLFLRYYQRGQLTCSKVEHLLEKRDEILQKKLKSERYLVVLANDAPEAPSFVHFQRWFPENYKGSRVILLDTRMAFTTGPSVLGHSGILKMLPKLFCGQNYIRKSFSVESYVPRPSYRRAWEYLCKKVFAEERCPEELFCLGEQIVRNCLGVRQVLDAVAKLLSEYSKTTKDWDIAATRIGYVIQIFFPDEVFYIYQDMPRSLEEKQQGNTVVLRSFEEKVQANSMVGMDDDLINIKDKLIGGLDRLEIITVLGMGGIGKTTLAKAVYDDPEVQLGFHKCAWIKVSQVYNLRNLFLGLLQKIDPFANEIHRMTKEELREKLYKCLKGPKFLIVMDDIWSTQAWDEMRRSLPDDRNGSRILLTSRLRDLADHVSSNYTHQMRFLNKYHSWELLQQKIFLNRSCPPELVSIGKKIGEKCKGLPLAILVIAGVLSNIGNSRELWENVAERMTSLLTNDPEQYLGILATSYNYLPQHLKACFLYLCAFPEDCEIEYWRLIRLWVAEGFVKPQGSKSLEEMAKEYLEDLIGRNLVLVGKRSSSGNIKTFYVHDLVRDLSLREAKRENFMHVIRGPVQVPSEDCSIVRRLSLHSGSCSNFHSDHSIQLTHSLLCFDVGFDDIQIFLSTFNFKLLRVLDIGFMRFDYFPLVILRLVHLRFIALTAACDLPSSISELWNLQTVIVQGPWIRRKYGKIPTLPKEIWKMSNLRHLNLTATCALPGPLGAEADGNNSLVLENIQTLSTIKFGSCTKEVFENMPNLKKLGICETKEDSDSCKGLSSFPRNLFYLHNLETLKCFFNCLNQKNFRLPDWNAFPEKLKNLTLSSCFLPWEDMDILGMLPNLEVLKLKNYAFQGQVWEPNEEGFQRLKLLLIEKSDLVHWRASKDNFPCLQFLVLNSCEFLEEIPCDIADSLELIDLHNCSSSAESSAKRIQEEQRDLSNESLVVRIVNSR